MTPKKPSPQQEPIPADDTPAVMAYRMGQLEVAVLSMRDELTGLTSNFATKQEILELKARATLEHKIIENKVDTVRIDLEKEIRLLKRRRFIDGMLVSVASIVITLLVTYVFYDVLSR